MPLDFPRARALLQSCDLPRLFVEELGWEPCRQKLTLRVGENDFAFAAIAEKRGFTAWLCESPNGGLPDRATRLKLDRKLSETSFEHLIVFVTHDRSGQSWMWVRREQGKPLAARTHEYRKDQPGDSLLQKLQILYVSLNEEEAGISTVDVAGRARAAFDIERVTKAFYRDFDTHRKAFLKFIDGIDEVADCEWYASVMLNRLMFVYFIQRKGFLDGDTNYLRQRLERCKKEQGEDKFYTFYRYFLLRLFHEGFGKRPKDRAPDLEKLLGNIPYLNGGLFDVHELEKPGRYGKHIAIPDKAFELIFRYFDQYQWHLDERPLSADNEINPDVLGYIFEKYINQKQMGAYYTKEDITEYISKNTILPFLFDAARAECKVAFENPDGPTVWDLLREDPDRYIYPTVRHGANKKLPPEIAAGLDTTQPNLFERRRPWNKPAPADYALPTEIWREVVARRQRYEEVRKKLAGGEVREVNDFITLNLDLRQFAQDVILNSEGPDLLRAVWYAIQKVTVLDPTCGSGAFIFAALNILEPLYEICLDRMEAFVADDDRDRPRAPEDTARGLIALGESQTLELKATARWNLRESKADKAMEQMIVKTVAAFLNSDGGNLLIGVQDDGSIVGIEPDHQVVSEPKRNRDFYERWLTEKLLGQCGKQHTANLSLSFVRLEDKDVCLVNVLRASSAVYVKENDQDKFYVRTGNSTQALTPVEAADYEKQRSLNAAPQPKVAEIAKLSGPKKYSDFRKVIELVAAHPKRSYFILKSIILNNLFGVDIMEEAVEICKLRLFLKLAAQVEPDATKDNLGIEPLPDVDFNIRAGNTLVGYATEDEVRRCMKESGGGQKKFMYDDDQATFDRFDVRCAEVEQAFTKFRQRQTDGDGSVPAADKLELQKRLKVLEDELNRHLAGEYGVTVSDKGAYAKWVKSHQPFHWFIQFYGILNGGGFDVIIGNPPYVEYKEVKQDYRIRGYATEECGNLYAFTWERSIALANQAGHVGLIIPVASVCTDGYAALRRIWFSNGSVVASNFNDRPGKLFDGLEHIRLSIVLFAKRKEGDRRIHTTTYNKWITEARDHLFQTLSFTDTTGLVRGGSMPKVGSSIEATVWAKISSCSKTLQDFTVTSGRNRFLYTRKLSWFVQILDFVPGITDGRGRKREPSELKEVVVATEQHRNAFLCVLNSTLFYWWLTVWSDCRNLNKREVLGVPFNFDEANSSMRSKLDKLAGLLMEDFQENSRIVEMNYAKWGMMKIQCVYPKHSKPILDEIDTVLAGHYGFTAEELDFIVNYDIKYRLGRNTEADGE
jgi:hypothetical protein